MTHLIKIGDGYKDDSDSEEVYWDVHDLARTNAPMSSGISGQSNRRDHSSGYFHEMVKETKMEDWWGQMSQWGPRYGYKELNQEDLDLFKKRYEELKDVEEYRGFHEKFKEEDAVEWFDFLIYWMDYTLKNSKNPMIVVS